MDVRRSKAGRGISRHGSRVAAQLAQQRARAVRADAGLEVEAFGDVQAAPVFNTEGVALICAALPVMILLQRTFLD